MAHSAARCGESGRHFAPGSLAVLVFSLLLLAGCVGGPPPAAEGAAEADSAQVSAPESAAEPEADIAAAEVAPAAEEPAAGAGQEAAAPPPVVFKAEDIEGFVKAARFGQADSIKYYLDRKFPVDESDFLGNTALISAANGGHAAIVDTLLKAGANPNAQRNDGRTALMAAAARGDIAVIKRLVEAGAEVNIKDQQGETALFDAVRYGHLDAVKALLAAGADPNVQNNLRANRPNGGYTPLMYAADHVADLVSARDWLQIVNTLLENGADPDIRDTKGRSALSLALDRGHVDLASALEEHGAKQVLTYSGLGLNDALILAASNGDARKVRESLTLGADPNAVNRAGVGPLMAAVYGGSLDAVKALVEARARIDRVPTGFRAWTWTGARLSLGVQPLARAASIGDTALILAARGGHADIAAYLLAQGANPSLKNLHDDSPLSVAAERGDADIIALLLAKNVDPNEGTQSSHEFLGRTLVGLKDVQRNTPLIKAAQGGHEAAVQALLEAGADPDVRGMAGKVALYWAVERGHQKVVRLLLDHHADPDIKSQAGLTPLMEAAKTGRLPMVEALVKKGADVNAREGDEVLPGTIDVSGGAGMTPLMFAAVGGHAKVVEALLRAGADVKLRNRNGQTAQDEAAKNGYQDIVQLIRSVNVASGQ